MEGIPKHQKVSFAVPSFMMFAYDSNNPGVVVALLYAVGFKVTLLFWELQTRHLRCL
jgi:hypothetical protein